MSEALELVQDAKPRRFRPYPQYKDSGVEWLGKIPAHWGVKRIKNLASFVTSGSRGWAEYYADEGALFLRIGNLRSGSIELDLNDVQHVDPPRGAEGERTRVQPGDIVVSITALIGAVAVVPDGLSQAFVNQHLGLVRPSPQYTGSRWLAYCLLSQVGQAQFAVELYGGTKDGLSLDDIRSLLVLIPPSREEQDEIVAFLDRETAKIDALVARKERLIELLQEKRTALITRAVTRGLDPNVPTKDSGVEWLGEIPVHWKVTRLRYACSLLRDGTHQPPPRVTDGYPLLSVRNIVGGRFTRLPDDSMISETDFRTLERSFVVQQKDLLLAVVGATLGKVAIVGLLEPFTIQRSLAVLRPRPGLLEHEYLAHFLGSRPFQGLLWRSTGFSAQPGIYLGALASFHLPIPPIEEQSEILESLRLAIEPLDDLIRRVHDAIDRLKEFRTALISAAVTGKIDVREDVS